MYCPKCGSKICEQEKFCKYCGSKLIDIENDNNNNSYLSDKLLIEAYVGKNYEKINNNKFSIPTLLFGFFYFLYRKLYLYTFFLFLLYIVTGILFYDYIYIVNIIISILLAINFSNIYMSFVKQKINEIKIENKNKSNDELLEICKKRGGTSAIPVVVVSLSIFIIVVFVISWFIFYDMYDEFESPDLEQNEITTTELKYEIPEDFIRSNYNSENFKVFNYTDDNDYCSISISIHDSYFKQSAKDYLKSHINSSEDDNVSDISSLEINDYNWEHVKIEDSYKQRNRLLTIFDKTIYDIEYTIYKDESNYCSKQYEIFINSLNFGKNNKDFNTI